MTAITKGRNIQNLDVSKKEISIRRKSIIRKLQLLKVAAEK